jgi:hypothetical protein
MPGRWSASAIIEGVSSRLSRVPVHGRRRLAGTLVLFAMLFVAVAAVAATGRGTAAAPVFCAVALCAAILLGLIAWGLQRSISIDVAEQRLDAAIDETMKAHGGPAAMCDCGHEHDPNELHVTDACEHDGSGAACAHDCDTCVLAALRPSTS